MEIVDLKVKGRRRSSGGIETKREGRKTNCCIFMGHVLTVNKKTFLPKVMMLEK